MDHFNDIGDDEFIPFLHSLAVETFKKSFEWMLHDPEFAHVLKWLYKNLDQNNALSPREEYRYIELMKNNALLTPDELEATISSLQHEFEGLCLPGDQESLEDMKLDISMQKERLAMLEKHEEIVNDLIKQNNLIKEQLDIDLTKLRASEQQYIEDETALGEQCITLAEEVESVVDNVCDTIADNLNSCSSTDKEFSRKFFAFGPFESYRQSQALFMSHFDLFVSKRFHEKQMEKHSNQDLQLVLSEAKAVEDRLSTAICSYITTKAELSGEQAQMRLVLDYQDVSPSQILPTLEGQNAIDILYREENILEQQLQDAANNFVSMRTNVAVETAARTALNTRERVDKDLSFLLEATREALSLDKLLYYALRNELRSLEELWHFASHLRQYIISENEAVRGRIESMNEICSEQLLAEQRLQSSNTLLNTLYMLLRAEPSQDAVPLVRLHSELKSSIKELTEEMKEGFKKKEIFLCNLKQLRQPLEEYIWDGCTKQPNCYDRSAASMWHELMGEMDKVDKKVQEASGQFTSVKNGDKRGLRKIWQWFLTDKGKLLSFIKSAQSTGYM